ncbi:hypothetical protein GGI43DRAFT_393084 [Trichoderma evansii]
MHFAPVCPVPCCHRFFLFQWLYPYCFCICYCRGSVHQYGWLQVGSEYRVLWVLLYCVPLPWQDSPRRFQTPPRSATTTTTRCVFPWQRTNVRGILIILVSGDRDMGV